jgi:hypothetical protein
VKWLLKQKIDIKCIEVTLYSHDGKNFIYPEQILPPISIMARRKKRAQTRHDKSPIVFSKIGILPGEKLKLVRKDGTKEECTVIGDKQRVRYGEEEFPTLAALLRKVGQYEGKDHAAPKQFTYGTETLYALRIRLNNERKVEI